MESSEDNNNRAIKKKLGEYSLWMSEGTEHDTHILHSRDYDQVNVFF